MYGNFVILVFVMKKINLVCVGKIKESYLKDGISEYVKRISRFAQVSIKELPDYATEDNSCIKKESDLILKELIGYVIILDINGNAFDSVTLAKKIDSAFITNSEVTFVIVGSKGYDDRVREKSNLSVSFGKVTFPHQLMRLMTLEQIYRAFSIIEGMPYHK